MGMDNFHKFFSVLVTMKTKSLSLTKQVLEERKRLETTVDGLQPLIKIGLSKMEDMRRTKQMLSLFFIPITLIINYSVYECRFTKFIIDSICL